MWLLLQLMSCRGFRCHCLDGVQSCDLCLFPPSSSFSSWTVVSLHHLAGLPREVLHSSTLPPPPPQPPPHHHLWPLKSNLTLSPVGPSQKCLPRVFLVYLLFLQTGPSLTTSLHLPQVSSFLMWTPPKPPPIFLEPTSDDLIPNQRLLRTHSMAFSSWSQPIPYPTPLCSSFFPKLQTSHCLQAFVPVFCFFSFSFFFKIVYWFCFIFYLFILI